MISPMKQKNPQLRLLKDEPKAYGGELLKTRKGRSRGRPLDTRNTMHLVLRSSKATGAWSFWRPENKNKIRQSVTKFSQKYGIKILSMANVGNHLHFHIKVSNRHTYKAFIRAMTASIAMTVTGASRWKPLSERVAEIRRTRDFRQSKKIVKNGADLKSKTSRFWDYRPFTRVVLGLRALLNLRDYIEINQLEGFGFQRPQAKFFLKWNQLKILSEPDF
jgi:REP element-mobilizing transposase RayT